MFNIRKNVFETNSSSSHSIVVSNNADYKNKYYFNASVNMDGKMEIRDTEDIEFGRYPFKILCNFYHKVCFAIASFGETRFAEIEDIVKRYVKPYQVIKCIGIQLPYDDEYNNIDEFYKYGYMDHQSSGLLQGVLKKLNISLEEFLIDPKYIVIIDGDEYQIFNDMLSNGLIDTKNTKIYGIYGEEE